MREFIIMTMRNRERLIEVINKYRGRNPYPKDWIPFEPICENCGRIGTAEVTKLDLDKYEVEYRCTYCGHVGRAKLTDGKLPWRVEWVGVWYTLQVDFEPTVRTTQCPVALGTRPLRLPSLFMVLTHHWVPGMNGLVMWLMVRTSVIWVVVTL